MRTELAGLHRELQEAIELEHATIPAYLTAWWSIKDGSNVEVADTLRDIALEEMLHMALACNILNAIGGEPDLVHPEFLPRFPGPLPHGVRPDLTVRLRRASIPHLRDVFMEIEEPHDTLDPEHPDRPQHHEQTIGQYYHSIGERISSLGDDIFTGDRDRQLTDWRGIGTLYEVRDVASAEAAIEEIVRQGEGAGPLTPEDDQGELSHYYRFAEVVEGRRLVHTGEAFEYAGEIVAFDDAGVHPMVDDPSLATAPEHVEETMRAFARTYTRLVAELHASFNGEPARMDEAIGTMYRLTPIARQLLATPLDLATAEGPEAQTAGPAFEII